MPIPVKQLYVADVSVSAVLLLRLMIASVVMLAIVLCGGLKWPSRRKVWRMVLLAFTFGGGCTVALFVARRWHLPRRSCSSFYFLQL